MSHDHPRRRADARPRSARHLRQPAAVTRRLRPSMRAGPDDAGRRTWRRARRAPAQTLAIVESLTHDDLRAARRTRRGVARCRAGDAAAVRGARVRAIARRVPARVRRHPRRPRRWCRAAIPSRRCRRAADLRRACEVQARSHLLHLREGYLETRGRADALSDLIVRVGRRIRGARREHRAARRHGTTIGAAAARHVERIARIAGRDDRRSPSSLV